MDRDYVADRLRPQPMGFVGHAFATFVGGLLAMLVFSVCAKTYLEYRVTVAADNFKAAMERVEKQHKTK